MAKKAKQRAVGIIGRKVIRMYFEQNGLCGYCGTDKMFLRHTVPKKFYKGNRHLVATFDHIVTKTKGGTYKYTNGVCACARCNTIKDDMSDEEIFEISATLFEDEKIEEILTFLSDYFKDPVEKNSMEE